jgi:hypothetical protein
VTLLSLALCLAQVTGLPLAGDAPDDTPYLIRHSGVRYVIEEDYTLQIVNQPVLTRGDMELSASMAIFWVDRTGGRGQGALGADPEQPTASAEATPAAKPQDLLDNLNESLALRLLSEVYFEGPVEYRVKGERVGSADAFYMNLATESGWIADAELFMDREMRGREVTWRARAAWLQRESSGTLHSNEAIISTCSFEDRHLYVQTDHLELVRASAEEDYSFDVSLEGNSLHAYGIARLPLPPLRWSADEEGTPVIPQIKAGSSARFGTFIDTTLDFDASVIGDWFTGLISSDDAVTGPDGSPAPIPTKSDGHARLSWLGSRGVLVDLGLELEVKDRYNWETSFGGLSDDDRDRGLIRVEESDRSNLRTWLRSRGRYFVDARTWVDLAISTESDPGVQAEFWEDEFLAYEERDNYLNWRHADLDSCQSVRVKVQVDSARTQVEELPSVRALWDRTPIARTPWGQNLLYSSDTSADLLNRREGSKDYKSPFAQSPPFEDGFGDRRVLRLDSVHRFESPFLLGETGGNWTLTPYAQLRGTAWDEDTLEDDAPTRLDVTAGLRLSNTFWRKSATGTIAQVSPFVDFGQSVVHQEDGGEPVVFDEVDLGTGRDTLKLGLSSRIFGWAPNEEFDMELATLYFDDDGDGNGWESADVFAGLRTKLGEMPVSFTHDGRYSLEGEGSLLTRSSFGIVPLEGLAFEVSHHRALDEIFAVHYEAATAELRYRWTPKWEFEARQTLSFLDGAELGHGFIIRRHGHDLLVELGISSVAGEGGSTLTLRLRPELLFRPSQIGFVQPR